MICYGCGLHRMMASECRQSAANSESLAHPPVFATRESHSVTFRKLSNIIEDARTGLEFEHRVDVEESFSAFDALVVRRFVFYPVLVGSSLRDG